MRPIKKWEYLYWDYTKESPKHISREESKHYAYERFAPLSVKQEFERKVAAAQSRAELLQGLDDWAPPLLPPREEVKDDNAIAALDELHLDHVLPILEGALELPVCYSREVTRLAL